MPSGERQEPEAPTSSWQAFRAVNELTPKPPLRLDLDPSPILFGHHVLAPILAKSAESTRCTFVGSMMETNFSSLAGPSHLL